MEWCDWLGAAAVHPVTLLALGSALGGNLRYWLGRWIDARPWAAGLPWGTFVINVTGSLLLGFFAVWLLEKPAVARRNTSARGRRLSIWGKRARRVCVA